MKKSILLSIIIFICSTNIFAQGSQVPCSAPEFSQFDFWIGEWDLTWSDTMHGENSITKAYNDCVIKEQFDGSKDAQFTGMSVTTYNVNLKKWLQTWVDDQGSYLDFSGGLVGDSMILSRSFVRNDTTIYQRMVWFDIEQDSFTWNWEKSTDSQKTWQLAWQIFYKRK